MKEELEQRLMDEFPFMEARNLWDGESLNYPIGCECDDGWFDIIYNLCREIDNLYKSKNKDSGQLRVEQVKEKFGGLRFYVGNYIDGVMEIIDRYETLSYKACEKCGEKGKLIQTGWWITLCGECVQKKT